MSNDRLKFRAWVSKMKPDHWDGEKWRMKRYEGMHEVKSIHLGTGKITISDEHGNHSEHPDDYALMQWTGLYDSEGEMIWEGDIVEWKGDIDQNATEEKYGVNDYSDVDVDDWVFEVRRDVVDVAEFRHWLKSEEFGYEGEELVSPSSTKVIGNIYENPELINA